MEQIDRSSRSEYVELLLVAVVLGSDFVVPDENCGGENSSVSRNSNLVRSRELLAPSFEMTKVPSVLARRGTVGLDMLST